MFEYQPSIVKSKKAMITLGGSIRIRGEISNNNEDLRDTKEGVIAGNCATTTESDCDDSEADWNQRVRINLKATVSPNTMGFVELESGDSDTSDGWTWGGDAEGASGMYQRSNSKRGALTVRQAYIAHQGKGLLGMLAGFKAGHMLLGLGNGLFFDHTKFGDDALVLWMDPMENTEISLATIKFRENATYFADDVDVYALTGQTMVNGINLSADVTFVNDNDYGDTSANEAPVSTTKLDLWNIGVRGDLDVQGVSVYGDVEFQTGKIKEWKNSNDDLDLSGWALLVGAKAKVADVSVHGEFAYGSGDDIDSENDYEGFLTSIGSGQHYTYLYDQHVRTAAQNPSQQVTKSSTYLNADNTGLNNTWYINVGASAKVNPDVKVSGDVYYLRASEKVSNATDMDKKDIGVEVDGKVTYQIDSNFVYYVEAGYLFAGDFYANVTGDKSNIDDPWSVRHGIVLKF
jgi:hypothetical protein